MDYALIFLLGMLVGASVFIAYGLYQVRRIKRLAREALTQIKTKVQESDSSKKDSIKERLLKASELANSQMALRSQIESPSKNALHSKYKNDMVYELHSMEQQKLDILRTILAEGFDPVITVVTEGGGKEEVPLSSYVNQASVLLGDATGIAPPSVPASDPMQPKKAGKFMVYKGGKDDGTTH